MNDTYFFLKDDFTYIKTIKQYNSVQYKGYIITNVHLYLNYLQIWEFFLWCLCGKTFLIYFK